MVRYDDFAVHDAFKSHTGGIVNFIRRVPI